jgi:enoyl-CoA hydratase/carnithine racemase
VRTIVGIRTEADGGVHHLTLARPEKRNALSFDVIESMMAALDHVAGDPHARVLVIAADGPVFCSGHDLSEMVGRTAEEYERLFETCSRMMHRLRHLPVPVIARVQGPAIAAGCQLVAACDMAVAVETATFGTPGVKIGLFCTTPMVPLVRAVSPKAAFEMLVTGRPISASRALEIGLVNQVVPADRLDTTIDELARAVLASSPAVIRLGKAAFYEQLPLDEVQAYHQANEIMVDNALMDDAREGISAFLDKRPPVWHGH